MAEPLKFWFDDDHYCILVPGMFCWGWHLYSGDGKIIAISNDPCRTKQEARDQAQSFVPAASS
jgi:hypothetical protein